MTVKYRCTKCGIREADPKFTLERDTAYCLDCASLLKLGTSREALKMEQGVPHNATVEEKKDDDAGETV